MEELDKIFSQIESGGITIQMVPENGTRRITRFEKLKEFAEQEFAFWNQFRNSRLIHLVQPFGQALQEIQNAENAIKSGNDQQVNNSLTSIINILRNNTHCFSSTSLALFFKEMYESGAKIGDAAYDYFLEQNIQYKEFSNKDYLIGIIKSFIYEKVHISFNDKLNAETESLEDIRAKYFATIDGIENYYHSTVEQRDKELNSFKTELNDWKDATIKDLQNKLNDNEQKFSTLQQQYEEYMRLEGPAKYWQELTDDYEKKGRGWRHWAIGSSALSLAILGGILYNFPDCLYQQGQSFSFTNLKGTIVLAIIVSILIYLIRLFVKLSISAYHLSRDAKERLQLTHIYLSMIKDNAVDEKDRAIVLQSLFSRADTGLLKGDHSPSMPEGLISQVMRGAK